MTRISRASALMLMFEITKCTFKTSILYKCNVMYTITVTIYAGLFVPNMI